MSYLNKRSAIAALLVVAVSGSAYAANKFILAGDNKGTDVSGRKVRSPETLGRFGEYQALYGIEMWESGDHPCRIRSYSRHLNTLSTKTDTDGSDSCNNSRKSVKFANTDTFVRGLAVCRPSSGKVKGVKLYGAKLNRSSGSVSNVSGHIKFERPNCNGNWKTAVYCPPGKVAAGVQSHKVGADIEGLSLICETIKKK